MANTDGRAGGRETRVVDRFPGSLAEIGEVAEIGEAGLERLLGDMRLVYGDGPHQWVTAAQAEWMLGRLFATRRILFGILAAEYLTGLELRAPSGKRATDAG